MKKKEGASLPDRPIETPSLVQLLVVFLKIGFFSFGGGTRPMMHRETVENHPWVSEKDFLAGFAIAQVMPGANPVNLALYLGLRIRGAMGAAIAVFAMVGPAFLIIMAMGFAYRELTGFPATHFVLAGVAGAGVGATLATGAKVTLGLDRHWMTALIAITVFVAVGIFRISMVPVVIIAIPASLMVAWMTDKEARRDR